MLEISTDAQVIEACLDHPARFRELFDRHFPSVIAFIRRRIGPVRSSSAGSAGRENSREKKRAVAGGWMRVVTGAR